MHVFGYYDHRNAGDDAFMDFFDQALGPGVRYASASDHVKEGTPRLILGGGAVINEYFFSRLPNFHCLDVVGCSFPHNDEDVRHLDAIRDRLGVVALRSKRDAEVARSHGIDATAIPDLVFGLAAPSNRVSVDLRSLGALPKTGRKCERTVVFFLSDHYTHRSPVRPDDLWPLELFKRELADAIDVLTESWNVVMIPMSMWYNANDYAFASDVIARTKHPYKVTSVDRYLGPSHILDIVNREADLVVSMKYHGLVFGAICGKKIINIGNTRKNIDLMSEAGIINSSIITVEFSTDTFIGKIEEEFDYNLLSKYVYESNTRLALLKEQLASIYRKDGKS